MTAVDCRNGAVQLAFCAQKRCFVTGYDRRPSCGMYRRMRTTFDVPAWGCKRPDTRCGAEFADRAAATGKSLGQQVDQELARIASGDDTLRRVHAYTKRVLDLIAARGYTLMRAQLQITSRSRRTSTAVDMVLQKQQGCGRELLLLVELKCGFDQERGALNSQTRKLAGGRFDDTMENRHMLQAVLTRELLCASYHIPSSLLVKQEVWYVNSSSQRIAVRRAQDSVVWAHRAELLRVLHAAEKQELANAARKRERKAGSAKKKKKKKKTTAAPKAAQKIRKKKSKTTIKRKK